MKKYLIIADREGEKQSAIYRGIELAKRSYASVHIVAFVFKAYIDGLLGNTAEQIAHYLRTDLLAVKP